MRFSQYLKEDKTGFDIESVKDTRQWEEIADNVWKPIVGSGDIRACDRCNKTHEIHFNVKERSTGKKYCVGGGCALQYGMIEKSAHKSIMSAMKTKTKLELTIKSLTVKREKIIEAWEKIKKLSLPEIVTNVSSKRIEWSMGSTKVYSYNFNEKDKDKIPKERYDTLVNSWKSDQLMKQYNYRVSDISSLKIQKEDAERRLKKISSKLDQLIKNN